MNHYVARIRPCGGMSIGDKSSIYSATVMAGVAYDLMTNPKLRSAARADFDRGKAGRINVSPLVESRLRPDWIPPHLLLRDESYELGVEFVKEATASKTQAP